jgi:type IV pilus assembly protein PilQ
MKIKTIIIRIIIYSVILILSFATKVNADAKTAVSNSSNLQHEKTISLNFQDVKVRAVLQMLAEFSGFNIIVSDKVQGSITLHLNNIAWRQALDIILRSQGLAQRQYDNVLLIAPVDEIAMHEKQQLQADQQVEDLAPLHSELITINYGKATDIAGILKTQGSSLLSKRGNVSADARTNAVWIQDVAARLTEVRKLVKKLDLPVKQVLIEARIVNVDSNFEEELGVRFAAANISGLNLDAENKNSSNKANTSSNKQYLNMDLPNLTIKQSSGVVGMALARLGKNTLLDIELSAMESEGNGQVISRPKLITADQQTATIEAGEEIPYQQEAYGGATNVTFKKAVLSLNVTPQITPNGKVILLLKVNQDKTGTRFIDGVPSIDTREIQTQVLVNDGETIVLGGIYEESQNKQIQRVPLLGNLPIIGALFRHQQTNNNRKELLIFVTPHICE